MKNSSSIVYFDAEGRKDNLAQVLRVVKRFIKRRPSNKPWKVIIFTGIGEGPAKAYNELQEYEPEIIAVTFPPTFVVKNNSGEFVHPRISEKLLAFFHGVNIKVVTGRLPFDQMDGATAHNDQMKIIRDVLSIFGGSFGLLLQAVLQTCDVGFVEPGEKVIAMTGDCAALVTASSSRKFLSSEGGIEINEILCKPSNFTLSRKKTPRAADELSGDLFAPETKAIESKPSPLKSLPSRSSTS